MMRCSTRSTRTDPRARRGLPLQLATLAAAAVLVACTSSLEVRTNIDRIEVVPVRTAMTTAEVTEVTATAYDADGEVLVAGFSWSSDRGVIRLLARDRIQFQSAETGLATITASIGFLAASTTIDVVEAEAGG